MDRINLLVTPEILEEVSMMIEGEEIAKCLAKITATQIIQFLVSESETQDSKPTHT